MFSLKKKIPTSVSDPQKDVHISLKTRPHNCTPVPAPKKTETYKYTYIDTYRNIHIWDSKAPTQGMGMARYSQA